MAAAGHGAAFIELPRWHPSWCARDGSCTAYEPDGWEPEHRSQPIQVDIDPSEVVVMWLAAAPDGSDAHVEVATLHPPVPMDFWRAEPLAQTSLPASRVDAVRHGLTSLARVAGRE